MKKPTRKQKDQGHGSITRVWGDTEVVDAAEDLRVFIIPADLKVAKRRDPACCVFAQACMRSFGATKVLFFRSVAYVELPDPADKTGHRTVVQRFMLGPGMREQIENFDRDAPVIPHAGFVLRAPTPGRTFPHVSQKNKIRWRKRKTEAERRARRKLIGTLQGQGKYDDEPLVMDLALRSGTGAVHFLRKKTT